MAHSNSLLYVASGNESGEARPWHVLHLKSGEATSNVTAILKRAFNTLFGDDHLSWFCFRRSCLASICFLVMSLLLMVGLVGVEVLLQIFIAKQTEFGQKIESTGIPFSPIKYVGFVFLVPFIMNFVSDYLALLKTRWLIGVIGTGKSITRIGCIVFLDFWGTVGAFWLGVLLVTLPLFMVTTVGCYAWNGFEDVHGAYIMSLGHFIHLVAAMNQPVIMVPCVASTFFSSIWLWLYALPLVALRLSELVTGIVKFIGSFFTGRKRSQVSAGAN